jgi:hypothetical protein
MVLQNCREGQGDIGEQLRGAQFLSVIECFLEDIISTLRPE